MWMKFKNLSSLVLIVLSLITSAHASDCFIVKENNKIIKSEGQCELAYTPQSTFKITLSLMGFEAGILINETSPSFPFKPEYSHNINVCKGDHNPKTWMRDSCVWFSQVLTKKLGMEKFQKYVNDFNYGNKNTTGGLTHSWLSSSLKITPAEQIQFIQNMIDNKLPISPKAIEMTKKILFIQELSGGWNLYGKTGNGRYKGELQQGWFVGWIEKGDRKLVFAHHIADELKQSTYASFRSKNAAMTKLWYLIDELEK